MVERDRPDLSIGQQCALLSMPRSSFCYAPQGEAEQNLALMCLIDVQVLGVCQMTWHLRNEGHAVNEKRIHPSAHTAHTASEAQHQQADEGAQDLPLSAAGAACGPANEVWCVDIA